jgi:hypothetical protein
MEMENAIINNNFFFLMFNVFSFVCLFKLTKLTLLATLVFFPDVETSITASAEKQILQLLVSRLCC